MSVDTRELIEICEQLPAAQRGEVAAFARSLLEEHREAATSRDAMNQWLDGARGAASPGVTTDQIVALTRGDA